jgi:AcrR family transcriptional regulator
MKQWPASHPKAKLMARNRAAILGAARAVFLKEGYGGASMEGIAAQAGVSIMTLYRHAEKKNDLFAAVIESACHPADPAEQARLKRAMTRSLREALVFVGVMFQERLASAESITLFRAVMVETKRFPHLGDMAYQGLVGSHQLALETFLADRNEAAGLDPKRRSALAAEFLDALVGTDAFRLLLGLEGVSSEVRRRRAEVAADALIASLTQ